MQTSLPKQVIGCIGKCTLGLNNEELDQITDNINKTLTHPQGRKIFKTYLTQRNLDDKLECLALYETCSRFIDKGTCSQSKELRLETLIKDVTTVKEMAEELDGVPQIDKALLQSFNKALNSESRTEMLAVLEDTRKCCRNHLKEVHESFKTYALKPCPFTK
ncbi:uncharacterized protein LOC143148622 [Ptiloglossa arizonensis]|uniref:uncharacterized protein LOC143148622 n=1 Tax=Ptiloglossa arizonensis TaxID=3350558 RepID=UPI003FA07ADB